MRVAYAGVAPVDDASNFVVRRHEDVRGLEVAVDECLGGGGIPRRSGPVGVLGDDSSGGDLFGEQPSLELVQVFQEIATRLRQPGRNGLAVKQPSRGSGRLPSGWWMG